MTDKDKRRLRAEAVERLESMHYQCDDGNYYKGVVRDIIGDDPIDMEAAELNAALIDLLTDEPMDADGTCPNSDRTPSIADTSAPIADNVRECPQSPEFSTCAYVLQEDWAYDENGDEYPSPYHECDKCGHTETLTPDRCPRCGRIVLPYDDPVVIMRNVAAAEHPRRVLRSALGNEAGWREGMAALADMVERDYVRRDEYRETLSSAIETMDERDHYIELFHEQEDRAKRAEADAKTQRHNFEVVSRNSEWYKSQIFELGESFGCREPGVKGTLERIYGEWDKLKAERDEWHDAYDSWCLQMERLEAERDRQAAMVEDLSADYAAMVAERDEWKAKYEAATNGIPVGTNGITLDENGRQYADLGKLGNDTDHESYADSGTEEAVTSQVPKCDTREKLEADVRSKVAYSTSTLLYPPEANTVTDMLPSMSVDVVLGWLDRQAAITERRMKQAVNTWIDTSRNSIDMWKSAMAEKIELRDRLDALEAELETARSERDACADEADRYEREARKLGRAVDSLSVVGKDGREIKAGQSVYGLSDGRLWNVLSVDKRNERYPVRAVSGDYSVCKRLKAEWLTHEPPDSFERIIADASRATDIGGNISVGLFKSLVERCERIGGRQ